MRLSFPFRPSLALVVCVIFAGTLCACGGTEKTARSCENVPTGSLVITELMTDPDGEDTGKEYIELYNASLEGVELKDFTLALSKPNGEGRKEYVLKSGMMPPGAYWVLGDVREDTLPAHVHDSYGDNLGGMGNSGGTVSISCGKTLMDEVSWGTPTRSGHARSLDGRLAPDAALNDTPTAFCEAEVEFQPGMYGSPGAPNPACGGVGGGCTDAATGQTRAVVSPQEGDLVITEVMANPAGAEDSSGEWFEVFARGDVDLNGVELSNGTGKTVLSDTRCLHMPARSIAIFAKKANSSENGGLPWVTATFGFSLVNANGTLLVRVGDTLIDQVTYANSQEGVSWQLDPSKTDAVANDEAVAFCAATSAWTDSSSDRGSPGAQNATCPGALPQGQCLDGTSGQPRAIVPPVPGDVVISEVMADPSQTLDSEGEWFEVWVKADVDLNGVELFYDDVSKQSLSSAECIRPGAGNYVVFARNLDAAVNGGLPEKVLAKMAFGLTNGAGHVVSLVRNAELLDAFEYGATVAGASKQVSANRLDALANDVTSNSCSTSVASTYGKGDRGTPGAANELCP